VWINGEWSRAQKRPGPNFAGHRIVIAWGCGSGCIEMAMSDAEPGTVYSLPVSAARFALPMLVFPIRPLVLPRFSIGKIANDHKGNTTRGPPQCDLERFLLPVRGRSLETPELFPSMLSLWTPPLTSSKTFTIVQAVTFP
jgi:hypothetical protein